MIVFKNYFKILKSHKKSLIIYTIIFFVFMFIFAESGDPINKYTSTKLPIYVKDESNTEISKAVVNFIDENHTLVDVDEDILDDKLFYEEIVCAINIPKDFEKNHKLKFKEVYNDSYTLFAKNDLDSFLNQIETFEKAGFSTSEAIKNTEDNFKKNIDVKVNTISKSYKKDSPYYFQIMAYIIMSQIILIVGTINLTYNKDVTKKRNLISPMKKSTQDFQLILGHIVSGFAIWLIYVLLYCFYFKDFSFSRQIVQMMANALLFTATIVCFAVLVSKLANNENTITGIMNVFSLGSSFLTGVFVPQELLGDFAIKLGKIFPAFYYISNIKDIMSKGDYSFFNMNSLVLFGFSIVFIILTIIIKPNLEKA